MQSLNCNHSTSLTHTHSHSVTHPLSPTPPHAALLLPYAATNPLIYKEFSQKSGPDFAGFRRIFIATKNYAGTKNQGLRSV